MKMPMGWVPFTAARYLSGRKRSGSSPSSLLAVLGIAVGVLALTVILAVMNGFQLGFIETILELSSYHVRIELPRGTSPSDQALSHLRSLPQIASASPFSEFQALARGKRRAQQACVVRALPPDVLLYDPGMAEKLAMEAGTFDLAGQGSIVLGAELARQLGVDLGDSVSLFSLSGSPLEDIAPENSIFSITGLYRSGYYEYDAGLAFISLADATALQGEAASFNYGIKLRDRWQDGPALKTLVSSDLFAGMTVRSWRDYNRSFFGALRTEKLLMFFLVALIFVVVGLNIFQAQRRTVLERRDEIGLLRAVGASDLSIRLIFALDGLIIGLLGSTAGLLPGLLIAHNIGDFFSFLEALVNGALSLVALAASLFPGATVPGSEGFSVFSPTVFYLKEIPSRVIPRETILIYCFGLLSSMLAAWLASGRVSRIRPAEVLRYE